MSKINFYVGTYQKSDDNSIFSYCLDSETLEFSENFAIKGFEAPSYLCKDLKNNRIYATEEFGDNDTNCGFSVSSLDIKTLKKTSNVPTKGVYPCHVIKNYTDNQLYVSNYGSGSLSVVSLNENHNTEKLLELHKHSGHSINSKRQEGPHAHFSGFSADKKSLWVVDLGIDTIKNYLICGKTLKENPCADIKTPAGSGARHFVFGKNKAYMYVICELGSEVLVIDTDKKEVLQRISTLPSGFTDSSCAGIKISPDGKYIYASNRGHDSVAVFSIAENGLLKLFEITKTNGKTPRDIAIFEDILLSANQGSDTITIFKIKNGKLTFTNKFISCPKPVCII